MVDDEFDKAVAEVMVVGKELGLNENEVRAAMQPMKERCENPAFDVDRAVEELKKALEWLR